ncbi:MAG: hypothetical protein PHY80_01565, partial [Rickettsiales bacterium]|nr:hypothetical protein [Rickettsiales bacterium]
MSVLFERLVKRLAKIKKITLDALKYFNFKSYRGNDFKFENKFKLVSLLSLKKLLSIIISYSLIYSQILFSFLLTQSLILTVSSTISIIPISSAYADAIATAPQNIEHNPIDYIEMDNSIPINNGDTN